MSQTAARPWWADVQHLRPADQQESSHDGQPRTGRFDRPTPAAPRRRPRRDPELWLEPAVRPPTEPGQRRTIEIRGQVDRVAGVAPVPPTGPQRYRGRRASERVGPRPDRVALWAVLLGLLLILVAAISSPDADAAALVAASL